MRFVPVFTDFLLAAFVYASVLVAGGPGWAAVGFALVVFSVWRAAAYTMNEGRRR